jgi:hypothetical protein
MKVSRMIILIAPLAVALTMAARPVHAHGHGGPCRQDVQRLCPDITPGPGGFRDCLQQHAAELSSACQEHVKQMEAKMAAWRQACQGDVQTFCNDVPPGPRNVITCLRQHQNELSQACQDQLAQHHGHRHHQGPVDPNGGQ